MKIVYCLFIVVFSSLLLYCFSQTNSYYDVQILKQYHQANNYYNAALRYSNDDKVEGKFNRLALQEYKSLLRRLANHSDSDTIWFFSMIRSGELESYFDSSTKALHYYTEALTMQPQKLHLPDSVFFTPYLFAGIIYYNQSQTDSAIYYFKKAETLLVQYQAKLQEGERLYNMLGAVYYESGNYHQAKNYFEKATEALPKGHPFFKGLFVNYNINLATVLFKMEDYEAANKIFQNLLTYRIYQNEIYNNIGLIHLHLGASKQAIDYFKKVNYKNRLEVGLNNDIATAYFNLKNYRLAEKYVQLAISKNADYYKSNLNTDLGRSFKLMGDLKKESKNYGEALVHYQCALNELYPSFNDTSINVVPTKFSGVFSYIDLFKVLVAKAEVWHLLYQQTGSLQYAEQELSTYQSAFTLISYVEKTYDSDQARLFIGKIKYAIHSNPVEIAYELYTKTGGKKYLENLYRFDQASKASVLAFNRQYFNFAQQTDLSGLQKVQDIKSRITRLSIKANEITDSPQRAAIATSIRNLEIELGKKEELLSKQISFYGNSIPSIKELQDKLLDNETGIISYMLSDQKLTATVIIKDASFCYAKNLMDNFHETLHDYINSLLSPSDSFSKNRSRDLYSFLLGGMHLSKLKHLIIIPDNELCYLPFETLTNEKGHFLVEQYSVQYQYSTSMLKKDDVEFQGHQTLAFAPFASSSFDAFERLPGSLSEIENLEGKKFSDATATKINFIKYLPDYRVLHLATHAVVNSSREDFSYVMFSGSSHDERRLYASEISNLSLRHTDLVILSACETGAGNFIQGEGVMSLSRAFSYAGCRNIITSMWKADDYSTAYLTNKIHLILNTGQPIDKALQQAKLDYLNDPKINPRLKQPYYWSHLIFIGNISEKKSFSWNWIEILIASLVLISALGLVKIFMKKRAYFS